MKPPQWRHTKASLESLDPLRSALARYVTDPTDLGQLIGKSRELPHYGRRYCVVLEVHPRLWLRAELPPEGTPAVELFDPDAMPGSELVSRHEFPGEPERAIRSALEVALGRDVIVHYSLSITGSDREPKGFGA